MTPTIWKISTLDRETADGFVFNAHYTVDAKDDTYSAGAYGSVRLDRPEELIPYAELTETIVLVWVKQALEKQEEGAIDKIEAALQAQLDEQRTPSKAQGVPW